MFNLFKKNVKKDSDCCNIQIEEVKEECCSTEEKDSKDENCCSK